MTVINNICPSPQNYLTIDERTAIDHEVSIMETDEAAGIEALKIVQSHRGWISDESLQVIALYLKMPVADLEGVATFYNLIYRQPVGQFVIHICNSIACHLTGYTTLVTAIKDHLDIDFGQTTVDGKFTLLTNACLGGCDKAPVMMIADQHYQHLSPEKAISILKQLAASAHVTLREDSQ